MLVPEVFGPHPFDLAVALDDDGQSGCLVPKHGFTNAPLDRFVNQVALFAHNAVDVFLGFILQDSNLESCQLTTEASTGTTVTSLASSAER